MKWFIVGVATIIASTIFSSQIASAVALKLTPLEYRTTLAQGEKKKGYIDVSNPEATAQLVRVSTAAFRQIDDNGGLQFYEDGAVQKGIITDLDEFELGPREAIRMYFILDGNKLPDGDVYGAIFFTTRPTGSSANAGATQQVRVGTLFSIVNKTPSSRQAEITRLKTFSVQFGDTITGKYTIKNTGDSSKTTGFYPVVRVQVSPFGDSKSVQSSLVFAGRSRQVDFTLRSPQFGIYRVSAQYDESRQTRYVLVLQPVATATIIVVLLIVCGVVYLLVRKRRVHFR